MRVVAEVGDKAGAAARFARDANVAPVQDEPVVRVQQVFRWYARHQPFFDGKYGFARRDAGAVGNAKDVGIDRHYWLTEGGVQDNVGSFAPDAGEFFQRGAVGRHCAAVFVEKDLAGFQDVYGFGVVEADGFDVFLQAVFAEGKDGGGGVGDGKRRRVALFTPLSVACAERMTAISSSKVLVYSSSVVGCGLASRKRRKLSAMAAGVIRFVAAPRRWQS